jgi:hypothetical protein
MKNIFIIVVALIIMVFSTGCMTVKYNFAYEYEDLRNGLVRAELIHLNESLVVWVIHDPERIDDFEYTMVGSFSENDFDDLIQSIVDLPFRYRFVYIIASLSAIYSIDGYVIALYYENDARILIGKTAEHRQNTTSWLGQVQTGRYVKDGVWNDFINNLLSSDHSRQGMREQ